MIRSKWVWTILGMILLGTALAQAGWGERSFKYFLQGISQDYLANYEAGQMDQITAVMAEDVVNRGVDGTLYEGRDEYAALLQGWKDNGARLQSVGPDRYGFIGDDAAYATWSWDFVGANGDVLLSGESIYMYRATSEGWELVQQFNAPAPSALD